MEQAADPRRAGAGRTHHEVRDASPASVRELRQLVVGCHWEYQQQMLEILEWICPTERQFEKARRRALDIINGEERALRALLNRAFASQEATDAAAR